MSIISLWKIILLWKMAMGPKQKIMCMPIKTENENKKIDNWPFIIDNWIIRIGHLTSIIKIDNWSFYQWFSVILLSLVHWVASSNKPSVMIIKWRVSLINVVDFDDICCQILNWSNENSAYDIKCGQDNIVIIINEIKKLWSYESTFPVHGLAELVEDPGFVK